MSRFNNDATGDRLINNKGEKEKYRDNCRSSDEDRLDRIFGNKDMKEHVQQITGDTPHNVIEDNEDG